MSALERAKPHPETVLTSPTIAGAPPFSAISGAGLPVSLRRCEPHSA
jgi:hypothetical protein